MWLVGHGAGWHGASAIAWHLHWASRQPHGESRRAAETQRSASLVNIPAEQVGTVTGKDTNERTSHRHGSLAQSMFDTGHMGVYAPRKSRWMARASYSSSSAAHARLDRSGIGPGYLDVAGHPAKASADAEAEARGVARSTAPR